MSANAAFIGRLETAPGSGIFHAYYDDQLDITWVANANINGADTWDSQMTWAASLNIDGVTGWRLPNMDINNDGTIVDCSSGTQATCKDNEYGHLYYYGAGTTLFDGVTSANPGPFSNIQPFLYWSNTVFNANDTWSFAFSNGTQDRFWTANVFFAWAVHSGDVFACEGDFDGDGDVDGSDLAVFAADFGRTDCSGDCEGDFDRNNDVDDSDLAVFAADFGRTDCPIE